MTKTNGRKPKRVMVRFEGGPWGGKLQDFTNKPGSEHGHPKAIGQGRTAYVLDRVVGEVGHYRLPTKDELDRPMR